MNYYLITNSAEEKEVGEYPQTTGLYDGYLEDAPNSMSNLNSDEFPNFTPDLRFELEDNAILTDIISPSNLDFAKGLLMSEKAKKIFEIVRIMPHQYYRASLKIKTKLLEYYWLHIVNPSFKDIDFLHSIFIELLPGNKTKECIFNSEEEFEAFYTGTTNSVRAHKIILSQQVRNQKFDLLFFPFIHKGLIASELLCNKLKIENITGLTFHEQAILS